MLQTLKAFLFFTLRPVARSADLADNWGNGSGLGVIALFVYLVTNGDETMEKWSSAPDWPYSVILPLALVTVLTLYAGIRYSAMLVSRIVVSIDSQYVPGEPLQGSIPPKFRRLRVLNRGGTPLSAVRGEIREFTVVCADAPPPRPVTESHRLPWARDVVEDTERWQATIAGGMPLYLDLLTVRGDGFMRLPSMPHPPTPLARPFYDTYVFPPGIYELVIVISTIGSPAFSPIIFPLRMHFHGNQTVDLEPVTKASYGRLSALRRRLSVSLNR